MFLRDQILDDAKCLVFDDLVKGPAHIWYSQLSRTTRRTRKDLLEGFMILYGGYGASNARQYYHAHKRLDDTPMDDLNRLNWALLRGRYSGGTKRFAE